MARCQQREAGNLPCESLTPLRLDKSHENWWPINFHPGAHRGTEIRPASEACSTLRIGHHNGSVQVMAAQKSFGPALPPVVQRHIERVISSLQPKGVVKCDTRPCATLSEQNVQCLFDIAIRRTLNRKQTACRKDVQRSPAGSSNGGMVEVSHHRSSG